MNDTMTCTNEDCEGCTRKIPEDIIRFIEECIKGEKPESQLIAVLHKIQMHFGYLPEDIQDEVAQRLQIPTSTVSGVASFYHFFRLTPKGQNSISVCMGTACFVKGADKILEALQAELGISIGETTSDGLFSLDNSRCLGVCALAPVITINDTVYSQVTPRQVPILLNKIRENAEKA
jgi:NADH:ubiquinone oxidoreductase subunit E